MLFGIATNDQYLKRWGSLLLQTEIRSVQTYYHMTPDRQAINDDGIKLIESKNEWSSDLFDFGEFVIWSLLTLSDIYLPEFAKKGVVGIVFQKKVDYRYAIAWIIGAIESLLVS